MEETRWSRAKRAFLGTLRSTTVEPLFFLNALGFSMVDVTRQDIIYQVRRRSVCSIMKPYFIHHSVPRTSASTRTWRARSTAWAATTAR